MREIQSFPVRERKGSKYDYAKMLNGKAWELVRGDDFKCSVAAMKQALYLQAKARGLKVKMCDIGDSVFVQAIGKR